MSRIEPKRIVVLAVAAFLSMCAGPKPDPFKPSDKLLAGIRFVESGTLGESVPDGDGGKAIGPYQIHKVYWVDATQHDKTIGGVYTDCRKTPYAERVVIAYMARYVSPGSSDEVAARIHNGGCNIMKKKGTKTWDNTTKYWGKVSKELNK